MRARSRNADVGAETGFSLLELLVASFMSILVVGGMLLMLQGLEDVHRNTQELIDAQQTARLSLERMSRDLQLAGVGLASLLPPLPLIVPRTDGGIDIRHNQGDVTALLAADMAGPGSSLLVDDAAGFEAGMAVAIYDSSGTLDMVTLTSVDTVSKLLAHDGSSKAYTVANGTAVARVLTISYLLQNIGGVQTLMRQEDTASPQPLANHVRSLTFTYYNDAVPPQIFSPLSVADQLRIEAIEIRLEIETEDVRLNTTERPSVTLTTRVMPRALLLS
ncbi:MAG: PilW family protein [Acidobacteriota bacterium]